jgi:thiol:disulfide interchange protein DsbC
MPPALSDLSARIQASLELPGTRVQMLDLEGQSVYLAGGGRYAFTGPAWDLWHGVELQDVAQASALAGRLDRDRLPLDALDLGALPLNTDILAEDSLWVFVDPLYPAGLELLAELQAAAIPAQVVVLPVGGPESLDAARRLRCAASSEGALTALIGREIATLPAPANDCDTQPLVRALITARLLGVEQVPLLIAPDGRLQQGVPADLAAWLGEGDAG